MSKVCSKCKEEFPSTLEYFLKHKETKDKLSSWCRKCQNINTEKWRDDNRDYWKKWQKENPKKWKNNQLKNSHGISLKEYNNLLEKQNYVCWICQQPETCKQFGNIQSLSVDHDHRTGKIRGLLCHHCNRGLGCFKDDIKLLERSVKYLTKN